MSAYAPVQGQTIAFAPDFVMKSGSSEESVWSGPSLFVGKVTKVYSVAMAQVVSFDGDVATWAFGQDFAVVPE